MTANVVSYLLSNKAPEISLKYQIAFQCAPFLKRVKLASMINIDQSLCVELPGVLKGTDISFKILGIKDNNCRILFYREKEFRKYITCYEYMELLKSCGYQHQDVSSILTRLSERMQLALNSIDDFPHEIGIFLGYPIEDIKSFIMYKGKQYLTTGYWKVYNNLMKATIVFSSYDYAKVIAVNEVLMGKGINEIAVMEL